MEMIRATTACFPIMLAAVYAAQLDWSLKLPAVALASIVSAFLAKRFCDIPWATYIHLGLFAVICVVDLLMYFEFRAWALHHMPAKRFFSLMVLLPAFILVMSIECVTYVNSKRRS